MDNGREYVKLISGGNHVFIVERKYAEVSKTIKRALESSYSESSSKEIKFPEISSRTMERVIQYFHYKVRHTNSAEAYPEFNVAPEEVLDLLKASHYLDC